ncbi:hypothetical protein ACFLWA_03720 [Chloroflexota bacterium]
MKYFEDRIADAESHYQKTLRSIEKARKWFEEHNIREAALLADRIEAWAGVHVSVTLFFPVQRKDEARDKLLEIFPEYDKQYHVVENPAWKPNGHTGPWLVETWASDEYFKDRLLAQFYRPTYEGEKVGDCIVGAQSHAYTSKSISLTCPI